MSGQRIAIAARQIFALLCFCLCQGLILQGAMAMPPALALEPGHSALPVRSTIYYWVDTDPERPAAERLTQLPRENFLPLQRQGMPAFDTRVWLWLRIDDRSGSRSPAILDFGELLFERVELLIPPATADEEPRVMRAGLTVPASEWPLHSAYIALPLDITPGAPRDVFLAVETPLLALLDPRILPMTEFATAAQGSQGLVLGALIGIFAMIAGIALRGGAGLDLGVFLLVLALTILLGLLLGGTLHRIWPASLPWHGPLYVLSLLGISLAALQFTRQLFDTRNTSPRQDRTLKLVQGLYLLLTVYFLISLNLQVSRWLLGTSLLLSLLLAMTGLLQWRRGHTAAPLFTLGVLAFTLMSALPALGATGLTAYPATLRHTFEGSMVIMVALFALAIANYVQGLQQGQQARLQQALITEERNRAKSDFLARMSHEIRTPIHGVLGMAQLLQQSELSIGQRRHLGVILSSGRLLLDLVNDLLDYSKIEAGGMTLEQVPFEIDDLLTQSVSIFLPEAHTRQLQFSVSIAPDTPLTLIGDPMRLHQILNNLIGNAVKFTENGEIRIHLEHRPGPQPDRIELIAEVSDTGIGIAPDLHERLFQPFVQADETSTRQRGGTGLGLSIARQLARLMDGDIELDSQPGQGTSFRLRIQIGFDVAREQQRRQARAGLAGRHLLMIYDHPGYGRAMEAYFRGWGMSVVHVQTLEAALQHSECNTAELIFISSGVALHESNVPHRLQTLDKPVVVLQSMFDPPVRALFSDTPIRYLDSPCTISDIQQTFCEALGLDPGQNQPAAETTREADPAGDSLRILVAEDNAVNRQVLGAMLRRLCTRVTYANDGIEALDRYRELGSECDLILMDCDMPGMNGYQATEAIRAHEQSRGLTPVPVIAVTAHAIADIHQRCQTAGMDHVLTKPLSLKDLADTVQRFRRRPHFRREAQHS